MKNIKDIVAIKQLPLINQSKIPVNPIWEEADEFAKYIGITTPFVLRLFKTYGKEKVLAQRSWLKDAPKGPRFIGLIVWKLKQEA